LGYIDLDVVKSAGVVGRNSVVCGDCLEVMKYIPDGSVDLILADLPYGVLDTKNKHTKWDTIIPFDKLWEQYGRVIKDRGAIVLTATQPFESKLLLSKLDWYRYKWVWYKGSTSCYALVKYRPFIVCESVLVFGKKSPNYYPKMIEGNVRMRGMGCGSRIFVIKPVKHPTILSNERYPVNLLAFDNNNSLVNKQHPTQKSYGLFKYLIETYTKPGDVVLDNVAGSGTTPKAAKDLGRDYIAIEQSGDYCKMIVDRLNNRLDIKDYD
jgi:site-specific DNA-methyltransferase (adenine-specific)